MSFNTSEFQRFLESIKQEELVFSIDIYDANRKKIGYLKPLTKSHLSDEHLISDFVEWRNRDRTGWIDQRVVNMESTTKWLNAIIEDHRREAFLIIDQSDIIVGRLGFLDLTDHSVLVDSVIRGIEGVSPGMITHAFNAMITWLFQSTSIQSIQSKILEGNISSTKLHQRLGFHIQQIIDLSAEITPSGHVLHEVDDHMKASEIAASYRLLLMELVR